MRQSIHSHTAFCYQWLMVGVGLLILVLAGSVDLYRSRIRIEAREKDRLLAVSKVVQVNLEQNLYSVNEVLKTLLAEVAATPFDAKFNSRLAILEKAMPSVRTLNVIDITGTIRAASRSELLGTNKNFSERDYFKTPQQHPCQNTLFVSAPFRAPTGVFSLAVSRMIAGPRGEFAGVIVATLDPTYFYSLIDSVRYAPDVVVGLAHGDGVVFLMAPQERAAAIGRNLMQPGALFVQHKESGQTVSVISGTVLRTKEQRMLVQRTVQPVGLEMDKSLDVVVSRLSSEIYQPWHHDLWIRATFLSIITLFSTLGLCIYQRRTLAILQKEVEMVAALESSESRQRLRELAAQNETRREDERKHIAREVHDELGQVLTALRIDISLLGMRFGAFDAVMVDKVLAMKALVDRAILGVRNVATNLRPTALDMGLVSAVEWLCSEFTRQTTIACVLHAPEEDIEVDETRSVVVFRIVQESLTNITRYAQASQVTITLEQLGNELQVAVQDNGLGFDLAAATKKKTFGLLGMRERALAMGGRLDISSAPGQGTVIHLAMPVNFERIAKDS